MVRKFVGRRLNNAYFLINDRKNVFLFYLNQIFSGTWSQDPGQLRPSILRNIQDPEKFKLKC